MDPGVIGTLRLFKSQIKISESLAPEARRLAWKGLKSRALTGPVCFCLWAITGSFPEDRMWVTLYRVSRPLSPPPAMIPEPSGSPLPKLPQISL